MLNLAQIESNLTEALKARDQLRVDTLRALKTRIQNEQIAKTRELLEDEIFALIRSEIKRRKEAAEAFGQGGRSDSAAKELAESEVLKVYLPAGPSEEEMNSAISMLIEENNFTQQDFGKAMGKLKQRFATADGAVLAQLLKEKLN